MSYDSNEYSYSFEYYYSSDEPVIKASKNNTKRKILVEVESEIPEKNNRIKKVPVEKAAEKRKDEKVAAKEEKRKDEKVAAKEEKRKDEKVAAKEEKRKDEKVAAKGGNVIENIPIKATPNPTYNKKTKVSTEIINDKVSSKTPVIEEPPPSQIIVEEPPIKQQENEQVTQQAIQQPIPVASGAGHDSEYYSENYDSYYNTEYYYSSNAVKTDFTKLTKDLLAENYNFETLKKIYIECTQQCNPKHLSKEQRAFLDVLYDEMQKKKKRH